ncbi:MAG: crosslink repair DNA glycosylase YcaQ family protein, partial [Alphaproteobacteria bacterium]
MTAARLGAEAARRLFLARHGLAGAQSPDLLAEIERLGFVQIDSIATVERAHHMILASRRKSYRPQHLKTLHERRREVFEHWTHDAAAIPTRFYPYWRLRFRRDEARLLDRWRRWRRDGFEARIDDMLAHVRDAGPVMARDVGGDEPRGGGGWWDWHPSKTALEFLWRTGALAVSGRQGFQKQFDLAERVIPADRLAERPSEAATIDWACSAALDRLGFAASGDIARFWELVTPAEAKDWAAERLGDSLVEIEVEGHDGKARRMLARPDVLDAAAEAPKPTTAIRILSPFDPALRDRKRAAWLFGFDYRIEIFVPEAKRRYGYYVFPVLEGDRPIGRIDMKREGPGGPLAVRAF